MLGVLMMHLPTRIADAVMRFGRRKDIGDLSEHRLPMPADGPFERLRRHGVVPSIVDGEVIEAIRDGRIETVAAVADLGESEVVLADGARVDPDAVICATGYRTNLEGLLGDLDLLDEDEVPRVAAPDAAAPGMRFVGYVLTPGGLGHMSKEAKQTARAISHELNKSRPPPTVATE
jgi:hypothetical protein